MRAARCARLAAALAATLLAATPLAAQLPRGVEGGLGATSTKLHAVTDFSRASYSGITAGGGGRVGTGRFMLEVTYRQGSMTPDTGATVNQDYVEGMLFAGVRPLPWLSVLGGAHARAFSTAAGTERWMLYEVRTRAEGQIAGGTTPIRSFVELWLAPGGSVNINTGSPTGRGGSTGLTVYLPRSLVWGRLAYGISQMKQSGTANTRTVEDLIISVGIGGRR